MAAIRRKQLQDLVNDWGYEAKKMINMMNDTNKAVHQGLMYMATMEEAMAKRATNMECAYLATKGCS